MERHCSNAEALASYLQSHPLVNWVNYGALADSPYKANCDKITSGKASGIISFGIKGGKEAGGRFIDALQMILRLVNIAMPSHWRVTLPPRPTGSSTPRSCSRRGE